MNFSTQNKLKIAKVLYFLTKIFYKEDIRTIERNGIKFEIDLKEGIDLHLFLFGSFQKHVFDSKHFKLPDDGVVLDVGGNVGVMSLFFAQKVPDGMVHAFEPTHYAYKKFQKNLNLNPQLKRIITLNQCFVSANPTKEPELVAYSSWKIAKEDHSATIHKVHGGSAKDSSGIAAITIDQYCKENNINRVSLIKIDTDGHELEVLKGAKKTIEKYKPIIVFELCTYIMKERGFTFEQVEQFFSSLNYKLFNEDKSKEITTNNYKSVVLKNGSIDAWAIYKGSTSN